MRGGGGGELMSHIKGGGGYKQEGTIALNCFLPFGLVWNPLRKMESNELGDFLATGDIDVEQSDDLDSRRMSQNQKVPSSLALAGILG